MSVQGVVKRYALILEKVTQCRYPSFATIKAYLEAHGIEISGRTLQRDLAGIALEFGIEVAFDRAHRGYCLRRDRGIHPDILLRFIGLVERHRLVATCLREGVQRHRFVSFAPDHAHRGIEQLAPLYLAIRESRVVSFTHFNYHTARTRRYLVLPHFLREYDRRWYLIGTLEKFGPAGPWWAFGTDRISELAVRAERFVRCVDRDPAEAFANVIGISQPDGVPEPVVLSVDPVQGRYLLGLPLHPSQRVLSDTATELRLGLTVVRNFELTSRILMLGDAVRVISPPTLAREVEETLARALARYRDGPRSGQGATSGPVGATTAAIGTPP